MDDHNDVISREAEVAEELALRRALKRVKLEETAKSPSVSRFGWILYVFVAGILLYFRDDLQHHIWLIIVLLFIEIKTSSASVHSRIDAILELDKLEAVDRSGEETTITE